MASPLAAAPADAASPTTAHRLACLLPPLIAFALWVSAVPAGLLGKADAIAYSVCHRIDVRSFHLGFRALPLCARCTGMYLGALLTLTYYTARGRSRSGAFPRVSLLAALGAFALAWAVDGLNSYLQLYPATPHLYPASNLLRLITGTLMGICLSTLVYSGFNQTAWRDWKAVPALRSFGDLGLLLLLAGLVDGAILTENPLLLYPLALLSSLGVVTFLTLVYTMVLLMVLRRENRAGSWQDLWMPMAGGAMLAIGQVALLDLVRHLLTGTWAGFAL